MDRRRAQKSGRKRVAPRVVGGRKVGAIRTGQSAAARLRSSSVGDNGREGLEGIYVLVIDFDEQVGSAVRSVLEPLGAIVTTTTAAEVDAVAPLADVIICDLELIEAAGTDFLSKLRRRHTRRGRPAPALAFVTGGAPPLERVRAAGFEGYVTKPIEPRELRRAVWELAAR
jgi:CheY-like chemotaxis protein